MIGLCVGIGERHARAARRAARRVKRWLGVDHVVILGKATLDKWCPAEAGWRDEVSRIQCLRLYSFRILSGVDRIFHFDADWYARQHPDDAACETFHNSEDFLGVWDFPARELEGRYGLPTGTYFNGGFWVANRKNHARAFEYAIEHRRELPELYADQCILNQAFARCGITPRFMPRHWGGLWLPDEDPVAIHGRGNPDRDPECHGYIQLDSSELARLSDDHFRPDGLTVTARPWRPKNGKPVQL